MATARLVRAACRKSGTVAKRPNLAEVSDTARRQSHNNVEKQYRNRLSRQFEQLRKTVLANTPPDRDYSSGDVTACRISKAKLLDLARHRILKLEKQQETMSSEREIDTAVKEAYKLKYWRSRVTPSRAGHAYDRAWRLLSCSRAPPGCTTSMNGKSGPIGISPCVTLPEGLRVSIPCAAFSRSSERMTSTSFPHQGIGAYEHDLHLLGACYRSRQPIQGRRYTPLRGLRSRIPTLYHLKPKQLTLTIRNLRFSSCFLPLFQSWIFNQSIPPSLLHR